MHFQGAFFHASPLMAQENLSEEDLFKEIYNQLDDKFGSKGKHIVEDNFRVIRRGFEEINAVPWEKLAEKENTSDSSVAEYQPNIQSCAGLADGGRFFDQICATYKAGEEPIADPFSAISAIPAATGVFRDMTGIRFEIPEFVSDKCTGCGACWAQCPDSAIPGVVQELPALFNKLAHIVDAGSAIKELLPELANTTYDMIKTESSIHSFGYVLNKSYHSLVSEKNYSAEKRLILDKEFEPVFEKIKDYPLAKTNPFFVIPDNKNGGSGGLLSITVNPYSCKGCMLCVDVCPDEALIITKQTNENVAKLRHDWQLWQDLPDTDDKYLQIRDLDEGIGVLHSLLLKKKNYLSMVGGGWSL